jgi:hypothetical protein
MILAFSWCLVGAKVMVNINHFKFDHKSFFNFWNMIYSFENCKSFFEFKLFVLAGTLVEVLYRRTLEFVSSLNLPLKVPVYRIPVLTTAAEI